MLFTSYQYAGILALQFVLSLTSNAEGDNIDLTRYVDLFIGTEGSVAGTSYNGGSVFPGAALPFGVVKVGIDTIVHDVDEKRKVDVNAGYSPDGNVSAISFLHESGTGGAPKYGVISQMPLSTLEDVNVADNRTYMQPRVGKDSASVGYYKTKFQNGIIAEMSATDHAGILQYTYPSSTGKFVLVDLSHYLPTHEEPSANQMYSNGKIEIQDGGRRYTGYGIYRGGWNEGPNFQVFMCAEFDIAPSSARTWRAPYSDPYSEIRGEVKFSSQQTSTGGRDGYQYADRVGAVFEFPPDTTTLKSRIGISFISTEKACHFINEIRSWNINDTVNDAKDRWNSEVLSGVTTPDTNTTRLTMLYSALYRSHLLPSNRTGENPYWESNEPYYDDYYAIWDTFRCLNSFYLLTKPQLAADTIRSLIDIWRFERFMPDGRSGNANGRVQGGSNADNVLADAYVKGLQKGINWTDGYMAMKTNAEVVPYNNFGPADPTGSTKEGRGALPDWLQYGYVTPSFGRCISRTVEYSLNDFALSQVAKGIAPEDYDKYLNRSAGWQQIWHKDISSLNYTGFLAPTWPNGSVTPGYDPLDCGECEWSSHSYEALPIEYGWTVPFDMKSLIKLMGGRETMERRLDQMFVPGLRMGDVGSGGTNTVGTTLFNPGNEPSFFTPFLYNYLPGRQWKSVLRLRDTVNSYYNTQPSGLPGNSDAGAIDSWLVWNLLGLYPVVTQPVYLLSSPWFSNVSVSVGDGSKLTIIAKNLSDDSYFVQSVKVNGKPWAKSWVSHDDINGGGTIEFVLGPEKTSWDTGELPPSPGYVELDL
ncbi:glycosyl hydrolase [Nannizzia gypsea CBS 118893]|uniref:Glycosyl hydrolase n=1 Tax=Arthroderma gypseum (strain ATCC MYA-4604 / CBS 118893) TaxID=535722 RepID=E4V245_ARTGP|nr:glycosyl hydrolase [Nannizzia gypsea CBS 118893]EFR04110.1 glycosyl hydrolase [Nannizzia gypsea CBS 118893]